ncbi:aKG-HExxH-type peptide beta-hydroxylase [Streptomyces canus]|uniref:aKG-HExxH-type peptide beta-hydroxylase n=1 Tax=Streptomyces canus TaxID=58343 RepID=UPI002E2FD001|nr:HEXXH motif-containing putative peptide modification protein [Streptomyces canus]
MPSPVPPLRMPDHLLTELAHGGGSAQALAFLEGGERARRLLLLRTLHAHLDSLPATPLTPAAEVWRVFTAAADKAPEAVDRLLLAPQVGNWLAHMLRRMHGTAHGPPLWAEAGRLGTLAVAAALGAGTEADVLVPLTDGAVHLPELGTAQLAGAEPGVSIGRATARAGELTLTAVPQASITPLTCRPATLPVDTDDPDVVRQGPRWVPLRTLTHRTATSVATITLDDLDPYRDLDEPISPARLDHDEAVAWQEMFGEAADILAAAGPEAGPGRLDPEVIRTVVPWGRTSLLPPPPPDVRVSATSGDSYAAMLIARPSSALALAETLVHEFQHSKLAALLHLFPLLDDDREERYYAPWRADPRHLTGLLHGAYAFTGVAGFWRDRLRVPKDAEAAAYHFVLRRTQCRLVVRTLLASERLTAPGRALVTGLARTLDGWLREPVDPAPLARARTAAWLHRTEWRLRNVAAEDTDRRTVTWDRPRLRPDRVSWPDVRTYAFAARPTDPRTADEYLAAGDPAAALSLYADALAGDPAEPHALAGWIVARALHPEALGGSEARRLLARPERVRVIPPERQRT